MELILVSSFDVSKVFSEPVFKKQVRNEGVGKGFMLGSSHTSFIYSFTWLHFF